MSNPNPNPAPAARMGGRHQIKRSISELSSPGRLDRFQQDRGHGQGHGHSHHRHLSHHVRPRHIKTGHRPYDDQGPHTALPAYGMRHSLEMPRSTGNPWLSPDQSRRTSVLSPREDAAQLKAGGKLREEQEKASFRSDNLRQSLVDLNTFSTTISRRLDETYYAVLEKMSGLQSTVAALKDLAETSHDMYRTFETDSRGLENDIVGQLSSVGQFDEQEKRIEGLQDQISQGRQKMQSLGQRLEDVRKRVESWDRADRAWRETTRKRLKVVWTAMSIVCLAMVVLALGFKYELQNAPLDTLRSGLSEMADAETALLGGANMSHEDDLTPVGESDPLGEGEDEDDGVNRTLSWKTREEGDDRLRVFDEL